MSTARHEWIDTWCDHLQAIMHSPAQESPEPGARLVALPAWLWLAPAINIGRKAVRADGRTMLMPVRVTWGAEDDHVIALAPGEHQLQWSATGLGHSVSGTASLTVTPFGVAHDSTSPELAPIDHGPDTSAARQSLTAAARDARWRARMSLERYVERAVDNAVATVSNDILGLRPSNQVLGATSIEQVRDAMLLGTEESAGAVDRIIDRSLAPAAFVRVDPLHYLTTDLQRSAEAYVRRAISDPPIGRKIRRIQRAMPGAGIDAVVAAYRQAHPRDFLSAKRAVRALTAGADLNASAVFGVLAEAVSDPGPTVEDDVISRADHAAPMATPIATVRALAVSSRRALSAELASLGRAS